MIKLADYLVTDTSPSIYKAKSKTKKVKIDGDFLQGPIRLEWLDALSSIGNSACKVGHHLLHLWSLNKKGPTFRLTQKKAEDMGMTRQTRYRTLNAMAKANLIKIDQSSGQYPIITLINITL